MQNLILKIYISLFLKILIIQGSTLNIYFYINFEMLFF